MSDKANVKGIPQPPLVEQDGRALTRKTTAGLIAGASVAILVWLLSEAWGVEMPPEVQASFQMLITLGAMYMTKDRMNT